MVDCIACKKQIFVGKVGEIYDNLCKVHREELIKEDVKMLEAYLKDEIPPVH